MDSGGLFLGRVRGPGRFYWSVLPSPCSWLFRARSSFGEWRGRLPMLSERPPVSDAVVRVRDLGKEIRNSVFGRILRRTIRRAGWGARRMLGALPQDGDETAYRLGLIREDQSQKERTYSFSWGRMSYLDLGHLRAQYRDIFLKGQYEFTPDNDSPIIVDCGGNIGMSVAWFHLRYPQARITVFEPDPTSATILRRNVARLPFPT